MNEGGIYVHGSFGQLVVDIPRERKDLPTEADSNSLSALQKLFLFCTPFVIAFGCCLVTVGVLLSLMATSALEGPFKVYALAAVFLGVGLSLMLVPAVANVSLYSST